MKKILGGWQLSGVTFFQSGRPFSVMRGDDVAGVGDTTAQPWDLVGDPTVSSPQFSKGRNVDQSFWFNPQAFKQAAQGTFGNSGRNILRAPWFQSWDMALFKNVPLGGTRRLQLRLEVFNFPNHPNLGDANAGNGGVVNDPKSADFGRVLTKTGERNVQLGVKFMF